MVENVKFIKIQAQRKLRSTKKFAWVAEIVAKILEVSFGVVQGGGGGGGAGFD